MILLCFLLSTEEEDTYERKDQASVKRRLKVDNGTIHRGCVVTDGVSPDCNLITLRLCLHSTCLNPIRSKLKGLRERYGFI